MDDPGTMELLERVGAVELDGESWRITEAGRAMADALAMTRRKSGDDGINFDYGAWQEANKAFDHAAYDAKYKEVEGEAFGEGELTAHLEKWLVAHERIMKGVERPPFKPNAMYNKHGDGLEVYLCNTDHYVQWLCPGVEVMRAFSDERIVGFNVWGLSYIVGRDGGELCRLPDEDEKFLTVQAMRPPGIDPPGDVPTMLPKPIV